MGGGKRFRGREREREGRKGGRGKWEEKDLERPALIALTDDPRYVDGCNRYDFGTTLEGRDLHASIRGLIGLKMRTTHLCVRARAKTIIFSAP